MSAGILIERFSMEIFLRGSDWRFASGGRLSGRQDRDAAAICQGFA
jgi:hypothetical protein